MPTEPIKSNEEATPREITQLEDAELDHVTGAQFIWKGPGAPNSPKPKVGPPPPALAIPLILAWVLIPTIFQVEAQVAALGVTKRTRAA